MSKKTAPEGLAQRGAALWRSITGKYELRADELTILEDACFEADLIDDLRASLVGADRLVKGSMGQQVINPMISEVRQHAATLKSLLAALKLPDENGVVPSQQRDAANSRWSKRAG